MRALDVARVGAGVVFIVFGLGKFVNHASELASFRTYAIPAPELAVYAVGILEVVGGIALIAGRGILVVSLLLAADMLVAIVVSGIGQAEVVPSLTLAPALLVVMALLARNALAQRRSSAS